MSRSGIVIGAVVLLAIAAGTMLYGTDLLKTAGLSPPKAIPVGSAESTLMAKLTDAASNGGYALTFAQANANSWRVAPNHKLERFSLDGSDTAFVRLTSLTALNPETVDWQTQGLSTLLTAAFSNGTNGKRIEVGIVARSAKFKPAQNMYAIYATQQAGNSGWREIPLGSEFAMHTFTYDVPQVEPGGYTNPPIVVLRASNGTSIELLGVYVKEVPRL